MYRSNKDFISKRKFLIESIGWIGVVLILAAYGLLSFSVLHSTDVTYYVMNIVGSVALVFQSYIKKDYEPALLNFAWILLSIIALLRLA